MDHAPIRFYNTLTRAVEHFESIEPYRVSMYNCGPTVYDFAHIGNFKTFLFADVLRRFLELVGYEVHQVMNITDVGHMTEDQLADGGGEDKMALAAKRLAAAKKAGDAHLAALADPSDPYQVAAFYTEAFLEDAKALGLKVASEYPRNMPKATEHVADHMIPMIARLIERGHAYVAADGAVYYAVESFPGYGRLSGNAVDQLKGGAGGRVVAQNVAGKRHPADFLLWKPDAAHLMKWDSPWGTGYPGWHIECSAMAKARLGRNRIDIHTGGEDNIFPHHECEIAQTCGASGEPAFANFWMHSRHLMVEGRKMSKSLGNFHTVRDVLLGRVTGRGVDPAVMRFAMIRGHYRSNLDFSARSLEESASAVQKLRDAAERWRSVGGASKGISPAPDAIAKHPALVRFVAALSDDLNVAGALGVVFEFIAETPADPALSLAVLERMDSVLAVLTPTVRPEESFDADAKCKALDAARAAKDYAAADALRAALIDAGYDVKTTPTGTTATRKLA